MYYNNSAEIKAQKEQENRNQKDNAITLWIVLCAIIVTYIFPIVPYGMLGDFGGVLVFMILPIIIAIITIRSTVLYYRAHENIKEKNKLRTGSKTLLIMSLIMSVFVVVLWVKSILEVRAQLGSLIGTSGASGAWFVLIVLAPISAASMIGSLSFLIASVKLKRQSKNRIIGI